MKSYGLWKLNGSNDVIKTSIGLGANRVLDIAYYKNKPNQDLLKRHAHELYDACSMTMKWFEYYALECNDKPENFEVYKQCKRVMDKINKGDFHDKSSDSN